MANKFKYRIMRLFQLIGNLENGSITIDFDLQTPSYLG